MVNYQRILTKYKVKGGGGRGALQWSKIPLGESTGTPEHFKPRKVTTLQPLTQWDIS